ncbi:MAG: ferrous iron transport protein B [Campylobacterales bacterium]
MKEIVVALVGQPNVGKSHLINSIAGATLHVGNFSGVTVERKEVLFERGEYRLKLIDLPGLYSLHPYTPEEKVTKEFLIEGEYDLILNVIDSNQLEKNLVLTFQLLDLRKPTVVAFNMFDEFKKGGGEINLELFEKLFHLRAEKVSAKEQWGLEELFQKVVESYRDPTPPRISYSEITEEEIARLERFLEGKRLPLPISRRFLSVRGIEGDWELFQKLEKWEELPQFRREVEKAQHRLKVEFDEEDPATILFEERLGLAKGVITQIVTQPKRESLTERIDQILIHPILGLPLFLLVMWALFQLTFELGSLPVEYIGGAFDSLSQFLSETLPKGSLTNGLVNGVIPAIGAVVMFLPNILILFLGLNLMEQTGYMARAAYVMDGILKRFGLQGRSFIPLVSGFGCSVPAYLAARTLKNPKDRLITMLIIGFMSCGARLPIYVLLVGAFFPPELQGNVMFGIYLGGALIGLIVAKILRVILFKGEPEPFVMELPKYRFPKLKGILLDLWIKTKLYFQKAGTFIAIASLGIWILSSYPRGEIEARYTPLLEKTPPEERATLQQKMEREILENSYLAQLGREIAPIFEPLGLSWREGVALLAGLSAKEVVVSTIAVLYNRKGEGGLEEALRNSLTFPTAVAMIIFIIFYSPCVAAMGTFWSEVPQWKWRLFYTIYPNLLAWVLAFLGYQVALLAGG